MSSIPPDTTRVPKERICRAAVMQGMALFFAYVFLWLLACLLMPSARRVETGGGGFTELSACDPNPVILFASEVQVCSLHPNIPLAFTPTPIYQHDDIGVVLWYHVWNPCCNISLPTR